MYIGTSIQKYISTSMLRYKGIEGVYKYEYMHVEYIYVENLHYVKVLEKLGKFLWGI